jgi:hypothetical protein
MSIATLKRKPTDPTPAPGMRTTDGQDRVIERAGGWRHDRRVHVAAAVTLLVLGGFALTWLLKGWASSDATVVPRPRPHRDGHPR